MAKRTWPGPGEVVIDNHEAIVVADEAHVRTCAPRAERLRRLAHALRHGRVVYAVTGTPLRDVSPRMETP